MDWVDVVSKLGFPIAAFGICAWFLKYVYDKSTKMLQEFMEKYFTLFREITDQIGNLTEAVNNNTKVLVTFVERSEDESKRTV